MIQGDPVPNVHEVFAGASSKSLAVVVLEILASESDGGRTLVAYSTSTGVASFKFTEHVLFLLTKRNFSVDTPRLEALSTGKCSSDPSS